MINRKQLDKIVDKALDASFKNGKLEIANVKRLVKGFKSMHLTESIYTLSRYVKGLKSLLAKQTMVVESVVPPSTSQLKQIKSKLSKLFTPIKSGFTINQTQVKINPNILGGLKVQVGDTVLDYSVRDKLNQIKEAIING